MIYYVQVGAEVVDGFLKDIATQQVFLPHSACSYCEYNVREGKQLFSSIVSCTCYESTMSFCMTLGFRK